MVENLACLALRVATRPLGGASSWLEASPLSAASHRGCCSAFVGYGSFKSRRRSGGRRRPRRRIGSLALWAARPPRRWGLLPLLRVMARALDISEVQALVNYPEDAGFVVYWHHRVMLTRVRDAIWLVLTPDPAIVPVYLTDYDHMPLTRGGLMPKWAAGQAYVVDPLGAVTLRESRREAKQRVLLLGLGEETVADAYTWIICDPGGPKFGESVPQFFLQGKDPSKVMEHRAVVLYEGGCDSPRGWTRVGSLSSWGRVAAPRATSVRWATTATTNTSGISGCATRSAS